MAETRWERASRADRGRRAIAAAIRARSTTRWAGHVAGARRRKGSAGLDGSFQTLPEAEQAFVLALMEMVVQGDVDTQVLGDHRGTVRGGFSKSTVSALCAGLDARVRAFNSGGGRRHPAVRSGRCAVRQKAGKRPRRFTRRAGGIGHPQRRLSRILGVKIGDTELRHLGRDFPLAQGPWSTGVMFVVSDSHGRLTRNYGQSTSRGRAGSAAGGASDAQPAGTPHR